MKRIRETVMTMFIAARYSLVFCWKNSKKETIARLLVSVATTCLLYLNIQSSGLVINMVQGAIGKFEKGTYSFEVISRSGLVGPILFMVVVLFVGVILGRLNWFYRTRWSQTLRFANLRQLNEHRATLDVARFRSKKYDDLDKRIQELPTSWQTRIWFSDEMFNLFTTTVSFVLFGASLLWYKPIYALILVITAIPMAVVEFRIVAMWWNLFQELVPHHKERGVLERAYHNTNAFLQALMFNQMQPLRREIDVNVSHVLDAYERIRKISVRKEMITHLVGIVGLSVVIIHSTMTTVLDVGGIGTLTIIIAAAKTFQGNLEAIVSLIAEQWNSAKGVILIEQEFLGMKPVLKTEDPIIPKFDITPVIRFENVGFTYPDTTKPVLHDVNLTIQPGTKVAIVGKSGNGKSTIQALLMRNYDPTSGVIYVGDINLCRIEPKEWNNHVSSLTQEYTVLERCIGAEVASSRLDQDMDLGAVATSCRFADFDEVVDADPKGYSSRIGVQFGGRDFSGGERQRLALARVHYRGTPILVLDEPDAKLDPASAQKVIEHVFALEGVTVVMITHHVSCVTRCDQIIVVDKGTVVEQGNHTELMALGGTYRKMYDADQERIGSQS